jgi:AhpD family alkylhydroperoxidase
VIGGRIASSVVQRHVRYVTPVPQTAATGLVGAVYTQVAAESRIVVPPALLHSPAPEVLAAYWVLTRETLVASRALPRVVKEAVAAAVSVANICPYCLDMHSTGLYELSTEHDAEAIARDRVDEVDDPHVRAVAAWARDAHRVEGGTAPPFPEHHRPELLGVLVCFHYMARMANVFLPGFLLPPRLSPRARRRFKQGVSRILAPTLRSPHPPGRALALLPPAPLPDEARWAAGNPGVAEAVARAYAAFEVAGAQSVPERVRELVTRRLAGWRGEEAGLSREWCEDLLLGLPTAERAAGRLALLTAFASHQVDGETVAEFRAARPEDAVLVETAAWASFAVASHIGKAQSEKCRASLDAGEFGA